jgi:hypothetical protein
MKPDDHAGHRIERIHIIMALTMINDPHSLVHGSDVPNLLMALNWRYYDNRISR